MANYPIYRLVKGSTLTFTEMDGNLEWLSRTMSASVVTITGSTFVLGNLNVSNGVTGSLFGTSSWAISASWAPSAPAVATISSYIATGSITASVNNTDISASFRVTSGSNTLLNVTKDGFVWIGNGSFTNQGFQLDVQGTARVSAASGQTLQIHAQTIAGLPVYAGLSGGGVTIPSTTNYGLVISNNGNGCILNAGQVLSLQNGGIDKFILAFNTGNVIIQNGGTFTDIPSARLQVTSTTQGFLPPRMTTAQKNAIATPAQGLIVYDTSSITEGLWYYNSGSNPGWQEVLTNSGSQSISGSLTATNFTGSLQGTSSWAVSASWAPSAGGGTTLNGSGYVSMSGTSVAYVSSIPNSSLANSSITIQGASTALGGSVNVINGTGFVKSSGTSITYDNSTYYSASNPNGYTSNTGTVTSITVSAGTGMSGGGTLTGAGGTVTLTNAAPDQTVVLNNGTGISVTGTYPNFTIASTMTSVTPSFIATGSVSASVNVGNTAFNLVSSSNNLVTVLSNGNVGIGTTNPITKLHVSGSSIFRKTVTVANPEPILNITGSFNTTGEAIGLNVDVFNLNSSTASLLDIKENGFSIFKISNATTVLNSQFEVNNNVFINGIAPYLHLNDTNNTGYFIGATDDMFYISEDVSFGTGLQLDALGNLYISFNITASGDILSDNSGIRTRALDNGPRWKLGDVYSGTITPDSYIKVEINGNIYSIPALTGTP